VLKIRLLYALQLLESLLHLLVLLFGDVPSPSLFLGLSHPVLKDLLYLLIQNFHWVSGMQYVILSLISYLLNQLLALLSSPALGEILP